MNSGKPKVKPQKNEIFSPLVSQNNVPASSTLLKNEIFSSTTCQMKTPHGDSESSRLIMPSSIMSPMNGGHSAYSTTSSSTKEKAQIMNAVTPIQTDQKLNRLLSDDYELDDRVSKATVPMETLSTVNDEGRTAAMISSEQIREIVQDSIEDFRDELMSENFRFKAEVLKEFMQLKVNLNTFIYWSGKIESGNKKFPKLKIKTTICH